MRHLALVLFFAISLQTKIERVDEWRLSEGAIFHKVDNAAVCATLEALKSGRKEDDVVRRVAQKLAISEKAARPLVEAVLGDGDADDEPFYRLALREAPKNPAVVSVYLAYLARSRTNAEFATVAIPIAHALAPADIASLSEQFPREKRVILIADALRSDPQNPALREAMTKFYSPSLNVVFASDPAKRLAAHLDLGQLNEALTLAELHPEAIDKNRAGLVMAAALTGKPELARQWLAKYKPAKSEYHAPSIEFLRAVVAPPADPFDVLDTEVSAGFGPATTGVRGLAIIDLAERGDYQDFAKQVRASSFRLDQEAKAAVEYLPKELADRVRANLQPRPAEVHSTATPIARLLDAPRIVPFTEHPLPAHLETSDATAIDCHDAEKTAKSMHIPAGLWPVRLERHNQEVTGIAISSTLDPVGELGLGAYWVLHSTDGGKTWEAPLYTGLRENMPYIAVPSSRLPLMTNGAIDVEVELKELDLESITFPPVNLRTKREAKNLYIELTWDALRRDSDRDGLTDLMEERIGTDPQNADMDGDGIPDGKDGLPQVALVAAPSAVAEVMGTLFGGMKLGAGAIVTGLPSTQEERQECVVRASRIGDPTLFLIGDRATFAPINLGRRVVVFTPEEHAQYEKKFGPSFFGTVSYVLVRHDGRKAIVYVNESWAANAYELTKTKEGWTVKTVGGWIS